jgi:hypothetical protein
MASKIGKSVLLALLMVQGCSAAALQWEKPTVDVTGTWQGASVTSCGAWTLVDHTRCGAVQRISFTLFQDGADVKGTYHCAIGTMVCRNLADSGQVVSSSVTGSLARLRVMLSQDGSSCIFDGHFQAESGGGAFFCYQGGGLLEEGHWKVARVF